ncbi:hypothetical protein [Pseudophaeobacter leonis]|uniref:hypothetical protein n=1 Tax=Pseudophaeobacter leonis TaxID=1144477 RepID=UPI0009F57D31|nr:hypothetical protein [Pseudophaeobacter leonis]
MTVSAKLRGAGSGGSIEDAKLLAIDSTYPALVRYGSGWWVDGGDHFYSSTYTFHDYNHFTGDLDLATFTYENEYTWTNSDTFGIAVAADGTKGMMFTGDAETRDFTMPTPYSFAGVPGGTAYRFKNSANSNVSCVGATTSRDGLYVYLLDTGHIVRRYSMTSPFDPSTIVAVTPDAGQEIDLDSLPGVLAFVATYGISISHDGTLLHIADRNLKTLVQFELSTPYDLTSVIYVGSYLDAVNLSGIGGVAAHPSDRTIVYALSQQTGISKWRVA